MKKAFNLKKALVLVLVLVMCISVFAACDKTEEYDSTGLEAARSYVKQLYREVASETGADYSVVSTSMDTTGKSYAVEWSVVVTEGDQNGVKLVAGENVVTVDVDEYASNDIKYTLTATIKDGDHSLTIEYNRTVPKFVVNTWEEYKAGCEEGDANKSYTIKGYVVGVNATPLSSSVGSLWIVDETGHGYYAYKPTLDAAITESRDTINAYFPIGTEVIVRGTVTLYSGAYEFNKNCTVEKTGNTATSKGYNLDYVDLTDKFAAATTNKDESLIPYQATMAELKNATLADINGKNYYFTVGESSVKFVLYNDMYIIDEDTVSAIEALWTVGAKANIKGVVNTYSGVYQIYPTSIESVSIQQQTDAEKVAGVKAGLTLEDKYTANFTLPTSTLVNLTWAVSGTGASIGEDGCSVTITQSKEAEQTVTFTATIKSGEVTDSVEFKVTIPKLAETFLTQALTAAKALESGSTTSDSYILIGTVKEITSAYDAGFKNVTFTITDGVEDVIIFRYNLDDAKDIKVGDSIAITAPMKNYNGTLEAVATFAKYDVTSIADASAAGLAGNASEMKVYGYVKSIGYAYDSSYNNISLTITDGTNDLYCFRLAGGEDINVGDYILVTGTPTSFNGSAQMPAKATYTKSAVVVATVDPGTDTPVESGNTSKLVIADYAKANSWADAKISASAETDYFTATTSCTNPSSYGQNTGKYYVNGENWRIYQNETPSLTITAKTGYTIVSVKVTYTLEKTGIMIQGETQIASDTVVNVNAESVTFSVGNTGTATNGQIRVTAIEVVYAVAE